MSRSSTQIAMPAKKLSPYHPSQPEPDIPPFDISATADVEHNKPSGDDERLPTALKDPNDRSVVFPPLILGCSTFGYGIYADDDNVQSSMPLRVVRLALRSGMNAFDTSPWYHPSEIILGNALAALDYPRGSYRIITKVGKYGPNSSDHTYDPKVVQASVERSLRRLKTNYLDAVYLHDVEYALPGPSYEGDPVSLLSTILSQPPVPTAEELKILDGIGALRELQTTGHIILVGIAGYPLPILLRLALLVFHSTRKPLDVVQTYAHHTLQNDALQQGYLQALTEKAGVRQIVSASPLAMGLLTTSGGPDWHPAKNYPEVSDATRTAVELCKEKGMKLEDVALSFGYRPLRQPDGRRVPIVVGCKDLQEIKDTVRRWKDVNPDTQGGEGGLEKKELEEEVKKLFAEKGVQGWSWACPNEAQRAG
ncbi:galactose dehydrogenase [Cryptococcus neoformans Bt63]|nr:galactose dehydrogenase [Cryptococcus neoformans var. grubii Bt63]